MIDISCTQSVILKSREGDILRPLANKVKLLDWNHPKDPDPIMLLEQAMYIRIVRDTRISGINGCVALVCITQYMGKPMQKWTPHPYVSCLVVDERWRHLRIATSLVDGCIGHILTCTGTGKPAVLYAAVDNPGAVAFFESYGKKPNVWLPYDDAFNENGSLTKIYKLTAR